MKFFQAFKYYGDRDFEAEQKLVSKKLMETMPIFVDGVARDGLPGKIQKTGPNFEPEKKLL